MDFIVWLIIISLFILSFIALFYPVLPSVTAVWAGFLFYHFFIDSTALSAVFWIAMIFITLLLVVADLFVSGLSVSKFGGSKRGERSATIAVLIGSFIYPPFGILFLPFIVVFLVELFQKRTFKEALQASIGSLVGFVSGRIAEAILQLVMIAWFFLTIWLDFF